MSLLSDKKEEIVLVYGNQESQTIEELLKHAHDAKKKFRVIVIDSSPEYFGRGMVKRLSAHGIKCQYTLISMVNFLMGQVTKVFLPSTYLLCNGALVSPTGTSMISCLAHKNRVPVVAVCETYKFDDRVNLDQITNNEQGSSYKFTENYLLKNNKNQSVLSEVLSEQEGKKDDKPKVELLNLRFDLTPQKYLNLIVTEIGYIPPHSVPVVIREMRNDYEDENRDDEDSSDDENSSQSS